MLRLAEKKILSVMVVYEADKARARERKGEGYN
jgi:hypothetical protein